MISKESGLIGTRVVLWKTEHGELLAIADATHNKVGWFRGDDGNFHTAHIDAFVPETGINP